MIIPWKSWSRRLSKRLLVVMKNINSTFLSEKFLASLIEGQLAEGQISASNLLHKSEKMLV